MPSYSDFTPEELQEINHCATMITSSAMAGDLAALRVKLKGLDVEVIVLTSIVGRDAQHGSMLEPLAIMIPAGQAEHYIERPPELEKLQTEMNIPN